MHLHQPEIFKNFDVVIFDCPPRITTSVVNAVTCSDYVLIPTKLDNGSIDAVPRTVAWLKSLGSLCQADIGVVASHAVIRKDQLVKADLYCFERLRDKVKTTCGEGALFESVIPSSRDALPPDRGRVAATTEAGRELYARVAAELRKRMKI
jgi:cellulose biosynthesis protein BcsQ